MWPTPPDRSAASRLDNRGRSEGVGLPISERPDLVRKAIITSLVAAVLWLGFYFLHRADVFSFRQLVE